MTSYASSMTDYMEAVARKQKLEPPMGYGYKADVGLGVGCFLEEKTGCQVLEKPVSFPSGKAEVQGYMVFYAFCKKEGMVSILEGQIPPMLPATTREPKDFQSRAQIANNFGISESQADNNTHCVVFRVPSEMATQAETPGRDLWILRFDQDIVSPFLQAVREGNVEKVKSAISKFKGDVFDEEGVSALMMAAFGGWEETCKVLLGSGADPNCREPHGSRTALMFAAQGGHVKAIDVLLGSKADTSLADSEGMTPLMWAAIAGKVEAVKKLMDVSDKSAKSKEGMTALQLAEKMQHADCIGWLR